MIRKIELVDYKSYDNTIIDLKPITLFCGGNSSGKTAIIKSILLMKQSFEATGNNYLLVNGAYTNNGVYSSVHRNTSDSRGCSQMRISMEFAVDQTNPSFKDICRSLGMPRKVKYFRSFKISASFIFVENPDIPQIGEIEKSEIALTMHYSELATEFANESITSVVEMNKGEDDQHYRIELRNFPSTLYTGGKTGYPFKYNDMMWENCICYFRGMQLVSLYKDGLSKAGTSSLPVLYTIFRVLSSEMDRVKYIGPLRETPLRQYLLQDVYSDIGVKGENTAHYLGQFGNREFEIPLPESNDSIRISLEEAVSRWTSFLGVGDIVVKSHSIPGSNLTQIMVGNQNLVDVGFGVSQVLPILVEGLTIEAGNTLILEQPEIHLHPKMQMDIADFLLKIARQGKNLIVETHSDHIINRMVRRALEDRELREMIGIYYIEKNKDGISKLIQIQIDEDLGIDEAPPGFFDQYAAETESILRVGYHNMREKSRE